MARGNNPKRKTITVKIDESLEDEAREFVRNEAGKPLFMTMNKLVEQAIQRELARLNHLLESATPRPVDPDNLAAIGRRRVPVGIDNRQRAGDE